MHPYDPVLVCDWGDGEHRFRLRIREMLEVEAKCAAGIYTVFRRLASGDWYVSDVREVVRLGLIGAGMAPPDAIRLIKSYVDERPIGESVQVALLILNKTLTPPEAVSKKNGGRRGKSAAMTGSTPPPSTATGPSADTAPATSTT